MLEAHASNRATWVSICAFEMSNFDDEYNRSAALRRIRRHQLAQRPAHLQMPFTCAHIMAEDACHALAFTATLILTFNGEEEVVVIRNRWTPKEEEDTNSYVCRRHGPDSRSR